MYKHLSREERYQIHSLIKAHMTIAQIARSLGRSASTVSRELSRGAGPDGYQAECACLLAAQRSAASRNASTVPQQVWKDVRARLRLQWSPEQIAAKLPVSHESIYLHVYADKQRGGRLHCNLRSQKPHRKRCAAGQERRGRIAGRRSIGQRPAHVNKRRTVGHWEGDTVIGRAHQGAIVTLVERKSGYALLGKVKDKSAQAVSQCMCDALAPVLPVVNTITLDNGKEFAQHARVDRALQCQTYFADPYCSWQRGSNENFNGLLRQYVPKGRYLSTLSHKELAMIQDRLNHRPRKRLGFKTPHEVFHASLKRVALRA